jgi:hypothetical protein
MAHAALLARTIAVALLSVPTLVAQERPLFPDQEASFARYAPANRLHPAGGYVYVETRRGITRGHGRVGEESVKVARLSGLPGARSTGSG